MELTGTDKSKIAKFDAMTAPHKAGHPEVVLMILNGQIVVRSRRSGEWSTRDYEHEVPAGFVPGCRPGGQGPGWHGRISCHPTGRADHREAHKFWPSSRELAVPSQGHDSNGEHDHPSGDLETEEPQVSVHSEREDRTDR